VEIVIVAIREIPLNFPCITFPRMRAFHANQTPHDAVVVLPIVCSMDLIFFTLAMSNESISIILEYPIISSLFA
jgi:hypothetical protein